MEEQLFIALCAGVASVMEALKPMVKERLNVQPSNRWYQASMVLLSMVIGTVGAFALQLNMVPTWQTPALVGIVFTGIVSGFGSEIGHRILEAVAAFSGMAQRQANKPLIS